MALTALHVRDYQSLHHVDIVLAPLTVIVGPSSSGKSALTRALRLLLANARGSAFVSTWASRTTVSADLDTEHGPTTVSITRNRKDSSVDAYEATSPEGTSRWTKLGGEVPEEVRTRLGIDDPDLHFAAQFDRPYLLDESAATTARTLAALTNVEPVFEASRQANRLRLNAGATLRTRRIDSAGVEELLSTFENLPDRQEALARAEHRLAQAQELRQRIDALTALVERISRAAATIHRTHSLATRSIPSLDTVEKAHTDLTHLTVHAGRLARAQEILNHPPKPVPTIEPAVRAAHALSSMTGAITALRTTSAALGTARSYAEDAAQELDEAHEAYQEFLSSLGTCPTCGQPVDAAHIATALPSHIEMEKIHV